MLKLFTCAVIAALFGVALALPSVQDLNVIVVGAGVSGLAAARNLVNAGAQSVTILEGRGRAGGRVYSDATSLLNNFPADLGASWIYGGNDAVNPIAQLINAAKPNDLVIAATSVSGLSRSKAGSQDDYSPGDVTYMNTVWDGIKTYVYNTASAAASDSAFTTTAASSAAGISFSNVTMQFFAATELELMMGGSAESVSAKRFKDELNVKLGVNDNVIPKSGYSQAINYLINSNGTSMASSIIYNTTVTAISSDAYSASVTTASGKVYTADVVICTVPLGVLKAKKIKFTPALSSSKLGAMSNIKFGDDGGLAKVYLQYSSKWWSSNSETFFGFNAGKNADSRGKWPLLVDMSQVSSGNFVIMALCTGRAAGSGYFESMSDDALLSDLKDRLQTIFPTADIPDPVAFARSRWSSDPFTLGAVSYSGVGATAADWARLAAAEGRVHFAGEHTHAAYRGTTHGAYLSGVRAASDVLVASSSLTGPLTGSIAQCSYATSVADSCPSITFTPSHGVPAGGKIVVEFPAQTSMLNVTNMFNLTSATFAYTSWSADYNAKTATIVVASALAANTSQTLKFANVAGSASVGSTSPLIVTTFNSNSLAIDKGSVGAMFFDNTTASAVTSLIRISQDIAKSAYADLTTTFINAMLSAGIDRSRFNVTSIVPGSTVINFIIYAPTSASQPSAQAIFTSLQSQVSNPTSSFNAILPNVDVATSLTPSVNQLCSDGTLQPSCQTYFTTVCTAKCFGVSGTSPATYACSTTKLTTTACTVPLDLSDGGASLGVGLGFGLGLTAALATCIIWYYCEWKQRNYINEERMYPMKEPCTNCGSKYSVYLPSEQKAKMGGCCKSARDEAEKAKAALETASANAPPVSPRGLSSNPSLTRLTSSSTSAAKSNFKAMRAMARAGSLTPRSMAAADDEEAKSNGEVSLTSVSVQSS